MVEAKRKGLSFASVTLTYAPLEEVQPAGRVVGQIEQRHGAVRCGQRRGVGVGAVPQRVVVQRDHRVRGEDAPLAVLVDRLDEVAAQEHPAVAGVHRVLDDGEGRARLQDEAPGEARGLPVEKYAEPRLAGEGGRAVPAGDGGRRRGVERGRALRRRGRQVPARDEEDAGLPVQRDLDPAVEDGEAAERLPPAQVRAARALAGILQLEVGEVGAQVEERGLLAQETGGDLCRRALARRRERPPERADAVGAGVAPDPDRAGGRGAQLRQGRLPRRRARPHRRRRTPAAPRAEPPAPGPRPRARVVSSPSSPEPPSAPRRRRLLHLDGGRRGEAVVRLGQFRHGVPRRRRRRRGNRTPRGWRGRSASPSPRGIRPGRAAGPRFSPSGGGRRA